MRLKNKNGSRRNPSISVLTIGIGIPCLNFGDLGSAQNWKPCLNLGDLGSAQIWNPGLNLGDLGSAKNWNPVLNLGDLGSAQSWNPGLNPGNLESALQGPRRRTNGNHGRDASILNPGMRRAELKRSGNSQSGPNPGVLDHGRPMRMHPKAAGGFMMSEGLQKLSVRSGRTWVPWIEESQCEEKGQLHNRNGHGRLEPGGQGCS